MKTRLHIPLILPLIFFLAGIALANLVCIPMIIGITTLLISLGSYIFLKSKVLKSVLVIFSFFFAGIITTEGNRSLLQFFHFSSSDYSTLVVQVKEGVRTARGYRYEVNALAGDSSLTTGKLMMYTDSSFLLLPAHYYLIPADYKAIKKFNNPGHFDYGTYLATKNIFHSLYLSDEPTCVGKASLVSLWVDSARSFIAEHFESKFSNGQASSLLNAILLGRKSGMERASKELFVNNGLAHLLAISGMHVGIIFLILNFALSLIKHVGLRKGLILFGIWFYIVLTGMQIPAIRAGFMLSVFVLGQISGRNIKGLNSIFFAAIVMLSYNPKLLYQVSFQLSFAAMCSILIFYKPICNIFQFENKLLKQVWQLTSLNISVQIFVLPVVIYYFKQIPTYSVITSLISIPFVVMIMWGAIISFLVKPSEFLSDFINGVLEHLIEFYFGLLKAFADLPFSLITEVDLHPVQLTLWTIAILFIFKLFMSGSRRYSLYCMSITPLIFSSSLLTIIETSTSQLVIYDTTQKELTIDHIENGKVSRYTLNPERLPYFLKDTEAKNIMKLQSGQVYNFQGNSMVLINSEEYLKQITKIDICLISDDSVLQAEKSDQLNKRCKDIIIARGIFPTLDDPQYYSIQNKGAYINKL